MPRLIAVLLTALLGLALTGSTAQAAKTSAKPTVVLVHGAFADASGWNGVIDRARGRRGYPSRAGEPAAGRRRRRSVSAHVPGDASGPIVLVGHSYGGMVITNAATGNPNVKALVYVAAFAPDAGDTVQSLGTLGTGGMIGRPGTLDDPAVPRARRHEALEAYITLDPFREIFAADLPRKQARAMSLSQRPAALQALGERPGAPAWRTIPSWYLVAGRDNAIGADTERAMAARIHPRKTVEVKGASHVVMISRPDRTTDLILDAARSVR